MGPAGADPGGVGPDPHGDRGPHGHQRAGKPLEAEEEIPGETPSLPPHRGLHSTDHPASPSTSPPVSSTSSTPTVPLFPVLICPCVFLYLLVEWGELAGRWRTVCSSTQQH